MGPPIVDPLAHACWAERHRLTPMKLAFPHNAFVQFTDMFAGMLLAECHRRTGGLLGNIMFHIGWHA